MAWRYKILNKKAIDDYVAMYKDSLRVETTRQSKPGYHLEIKTHEGFKILGRVPKNIFKWYDLVLMDKQSGFINIIWHKFKSKQLKQ